MTRIERSPEQLDAEAAAPAAPLRDLILAHRIAYQQCDLGWTRMATETPTVQVDPRTGKSEAAEMSQLGPTLSFSLESFVRYAVACDDPEPCGHDHSRDDRIAYPSMQHPWSKSFAFMRVQCRRTHTRGHHEHTAWRGSLCGALVNLVVRQEYAFDRACYEVYVTPDRAERVLRAALSAIELRMRELAERAEGVQYVGPIIPEAVPVHQHHAAGLDGLHRVECPHPVCKARRAA